MNVVGHHARHIQFILPTFVTVTDALQNYISLLIREEASWICREGNGVLCPGSFEVRQSALGVSNTLGSFRRGAGKNTRGACAPHKLNRVVCLFLHIQKFNSRSDLIPFVAL